MSSPSPPNEPESPARDNPLDPYTLARLVGLHLRAKRLVEGYVAGLHRSPFRGHSIEFAEHRSYTPGDDIRHLDWKLLARTDKNYLKQFDDETNLVCWLVVDASESMMYRGPNSPLSKWEYAQLLASLLAYVVVRGQDAAALALFNEELRTTLDPTSTATGWNRLNETLQRQVPSGKTDFAEVCETLARRLKRRCVVIVISDFLDDPAKLELAWRPLTLRRHDLAFFHLTDPAECEFPFADAAEFVGLETAGRHRIDPRSLRSQYLAEHQAYCAELRRLARQNGIEIRTVRTDEPLDRVTRAFLGNRQERYA